MNRVAIIGAGRFGMALAESLSEGGVEVLLIERNGNLVQSSLNVVSSAVQGDATNARALEDAGRAHGCVRVDLMVWEFNEAARELYASCGYTCQSRILEKKLGPETE